MNKLAKFKKPKILFWDIETSHNLIASFSLYDDNVSYNNIISERFIICGAWKWAGEKKTDSIGIEKPWDDLEVVRKLRDVISEADLLVHHNGDKFDLRHLNSRLIFHGLPPVSRVPTVDTLKVARKEFYFNSNRLDYLGKFLKVGGKINNKPGLWLDTINGDTRAVIEMMRYNKNDVVLLENVYNKLLPFIKSHPKIYKLFLDTPSCSNCGSAEIIGNGWYASSAGKRRRVRCKDCGASFIISEKEYLEICKKVVDFSN